MSLVAAAQTTLMGRYGLGANGLPASTQTVTERAKPLVFAIEKLKKLKTCLTSGETNLAMQQRERAEAGDWEMTPI